MAVTPRTANGWGSVYGITGGAGGTEVSFSNFVDMWIWLLANKTTPAIVTYTGPDFSREGVTSIDPPNSTFVNSSRFSVAGLANKTIRASEGQTLSYCHVIFRSSNQNIIWENWKHFQSYNSLIRVNYGSTGIWVRHCELNGGSVLSANTLTNSNTLIDGIFDVTQQADYVVLSDCILKRHQKTCLVGSDDALTTDRNKLRVTYTRVWFDDTVERHPLTRFGKTGIHHCRMDTAAIPFLNGGAKGIQAGRESQVFTYRNDFRRGRRLFEIAGVWTDSGIISLENRIGSYESNTVELNPSNVTWSPLTETNYTVDDWTNAEMDSWLDNWAGATMHLMAGEPEPTPSYTLTLTSTTGGTVSRNPASGTITSGGTVALTATANTGFVFQQWRNASTSATLSTNPNYTHTMTADISIQGVFVAIPVDPEPELPPHTLTISSNNEAFGTVARNPVSGAIAENTTVTLTATVIGVNIFQQWRNVITNQVLSTNPVYVFSMPPNDLTIEGRFIDGSTPIPPGQAKKLARRKP